MVVEYEQQLVDRDSLIHPRRVDAKTFWNLHQSIPVLDVRSPSEFSRGQIPEAINLPVFDDQERARIGTLYRQQGRSAAMQLGFELAGPKLAELVSRASDVSREDKILLHCWRGGMRSQSVAQILSLSGLEPILLDGGYKSFRRLVHTTFDRPWNFRVVSGLTGVGKTQLLHWLAESGRQVVDLEQLAHHRGSAFGGIGQPAQPTTEQFENNLFALLNRIDSDRSVWIEDEGSRLGAVVVPHAIHQRIRRSPAICLHCSQSQRIETLLHDYGNMPPEDLIAAIEKISKRLHGADAKKAIEEVQKGNLEYAIQVALTYYDRAYRKGQQEVPRKQTVELDISNLGKQQMIAQVTAVTL